MWTPEPWRVCPGDPCRIEADRMSSGGWGRELGLFFQPADARMRDLLVDVANAVPAWWPRVERLLRRVDGGVG